jgi:SNF2 family DNA or RNA helicase
MFYCDQIKSVALTDYIIFPKYDDSDFENYDFAVLNLAGRPVAVEAVKAMLQNSTRVSFTDNNNPETYFELYDGSNKVSVGKSTINQITTLWAIKSEILDDMFKASDTVKFMETIRRKSKIPLADEWAEGLLKILLEKRKVKKAVSNIEEYYILSNVSKLNETINEYIDSLFNDGFYDQKTNIEIPASISGFVSEYKNELSKMILDKCDVLYKGDEQDKIDYAPVLSTFIPYAPQMDTANAISKLLSQPNENAAFLSAEMGCGKTLMSLLSVYGYYVRNNKKPLRILLMLPPHLLNKWGRETKKVFGDLLTSIKTITSITDINNLREEFKTKSARNGIEVYLVSRERAKLSYYWRHACIDKGAMKANKQRKTKKLAFKCPKCGLKQDGYESKRNYCASCGEALWQATSQIKRISLMEYMKKKLPSGYFDLFILDEAHEEKGNSARGVAAGQAVSMAKKSIFLTGTLSGGKPSTLHYLLWRTNPKGMKKISEYDSPMMTVQKYGVIEEVRKETESDNKMSKNGKVQTNIKEKPGISPEMLTDFFFDKTVFMKNEDLRADLPEYAEYVDIIPLTEEHKEAYDKFANVLRDIANMYLAHGDMGMLSKMLVSLTAYADNPVLDKVKDREGEIVAQSLPLDIETNKESKLIELVADNKAKGRKVLIYCEFTNIRDLQPRIQLKLEEYGYSSVILPAKVKPEKREQWITDNTKDVDVMICNPRLVSTGLDLYDFPTIVFYQTSYSVYLLRQASRRSWRIGQTQPVEVHFLTNQATIQETAMHLIADKMVSSQIFEGELPEGGLEELSAVEEKSFIKQLAESLNDNKAVAGSLEDLWKNKMQKEVESDDFIEIEVNRVKEETAIQTVKTETVHEIKSNKGGKEKFVYTVVSTVKLYPDKAASFSLGNQMYLMKESRVYKVSGIPNDMSKTYAGKYIWKDGKKGKYAICDIKGKNRKVYVGKQGSKFVALEIKSAVA